MEDAPDSSTAYRLVWVGAAFVAVGVLLASLVVIVGVPRWVPGAAECSSTATTSMSTSRTEPARGVGPCAVCCLPSWPRPG
jgi:hypothetical protein